MKKTAQQSDPVRTSPIWRLWLLGMVIAAGLAAVVINFSEIENFTRLLRQARPLWLIGGLALQATTYGSVAACWALVLRHAGTPRPLSLLIPLSISKLFTDQAVPTAGMSGNILLVDQLVRSGVPRGIAVAALLVSMSGFYAVYALLAIATLALLWVHHEVTPLLAGTVSLFLIVALAIPGFALLLRRRGRHPISSMIRKLRVVDSLLAIMAQAPARLIYDPKLIAKAMAFNGLVFLADAATLQLCLLAVGQTVDFSTALIALIMASIAVTLGPIPLGFGTFEAVCIAMLSALGVPLETAFTGTLLLRGLMLWLPLAPGLLLTRRLVRHKKAGAAMRPDSRDRP